MAKTKKLSGRELRRREEQRERTRQLQIEKEQDELDIETAPDLSPQDDVDTAPSLSQKDYGYDMYTPGATSWEEDQALDEAREKAMAVRHTSSKAQDLVTNILYSDDMTPEQKAKAIARVGEGFGKRVSKVMKKEKADLDVMALEVILAKHRRSLNVVQRASEWIGKSRIAEDGYPTSTATEVVYSLEKLVKELKANPESADRELIPELRDQAYDQEVIGRGQFTLEKDKSGKWRFVGSPTNNYIDSDEDIISKAAHEKYVALVKDKPELMPVFTSWHIPALVRKNRVDFIGLESGFLLASGPLEDDEAENLLRVQKEYDLGMSHGSFALERDKNDPRIVTEYVMVEMSDLPVRNASNPHTDLSILDLTKEAKMSNKAQLEYLASLLGSQEAAEKFATAAGLKKENLDKAGVESKEKKDEPAPTAAPTSAQITPELIKALTGNPEFVQAIAGVVGDKFAIQDLSDAFESLQKDAEKVPVLEALVKDLAKPADERLAAIVSPTAGKTLAWQKERASQSDKNILSEDNKEDQELEKSAPKSGWLSEATQTTPVTA